MKNTGKNYREASENSEKAKYSFSDRYFLGTPASCRHQAVHIQSVAGRIPAFPGGNLFLKSYRQEKRLARENTAQHVQSWQSIYTILEWSPRITGRLKY
ncbi:MAG TPA: hypothetical protein PKZ53_19810 [Acidobacteriota bacterium]|nr:hypothetical protein [Acidobacteriota bacterium]HNG96289.1 hypothetical protein [Acidobacteriota bacterium]HNJ42744.1 hypothetical protein [Acidobacteriota bacterium]